jgi:hypothetical protein
MSEMRSLTLEELFLVEGGDCGFWCTVEHILMDVAAVATIVATVIMITML